MPDSIRSFALFGATGGTGRHILDLASGRNLTVRALVRSTGRLEKRDACEPVVGDVLDPGAVHETLRGTAGAVCVLGAPGAGHGDRTLSAGTRNIIDAMRAHGVNRLVCVTAFGLGDSRSQAAPLFRLVILPLLARAYEDKGRQERCITESDLIWTIVRPTHLTDGRPRGRVRHIAERSRWYDSIARADVAEFVVDQLTDNRFHHQAVSIGAV